jgi:TrpR family transcriptional regulator, trp operon repressor
MGRMKFFDEESKRDSKFLDELIDALSKIENRDRMKDFLEGILTPKELVEIPLRLQIIKKLKRGDSQHQTASDLGIGVGTVTRGAKELQKGHFKNI